MNLSKELKKKRDAEDRLRQTSPQKIFFDDGFIDLSQFANKNHTHKFVDLTDTPNNYIADKFVKVNAEGTALEYGDGGGGGISEIPQATETVLGGIKASPKTSGETQEVKIDEATGKLYTQNTGGGISLPDFMPISENGIKIYDVQNNLIATIGRVIDENAISEIDLIPKMTSDSTPSGIASASSKYNNSYEPWGAFDKTSHQWISSSGSKVGWLAYEFPEPKVVNKYTLQCGNNRETAMPLNWTIEGWDGNLWTILDIQTSITNWNNGVKKVFEFNNSTAYLKYRINVTENNGYSTLQIGEWELIYTSPIMYRYGLFTEQYLKKITEDSLPAASAEHRGQIITILGSTGIADVSYICMKNTSDSFEWVAI